MSIVSVLLSLAVLPVQSSPAAVAGPTVDKATWRIDPTHSELSPTMDFRSSKVEVSGQSIRIFGDLTIRGVTKPVVLEGSYLGITPGERGRDRIGHAFLLPPARPVLQG